MKRAARGLTRGLGCVLAGACAVLMLGAARPVAQPPPPPPMDLVLVAPSPTAGWTVKLTNTGTELVRIVADPRLLSFEVTHAGHTQHCTLPAGMIPATDTVGTLVVPSHRSWTVHVAPLFYCSSAAQAAALQAGATVTASFGFLAPRYAPPFAMTPIVADAGVFPARVLAAQPVTLADPTASDAGVAASPDATAPVVSDAYPVKLKTSLPERLDVSSAFEQSVNITVTNEGDRPVRTLITPPTLGFIVELPSGRTVRCGAETAVSAIAELTTTLAPRARTTTSIDLGALCGVHMRAMGLYRVRPRLDTRHTAPPIGATSFWAGESIGAPMLVRVREGEDPLPQQHLDPPPP